MKLHQYVALKMLDREIEVLKDEEFKSRPSYNEESDGRASGLSFFTNYLRK